MKQLFKDNMYYIYGILVIICATLAICFSTIAHFVSGFIILHWIFELVAIFMYHLFYNGMKKQHNQKAIIQCIIINYILLIAGLGILVRCFSLMASKNGIVYLVSIILFSLGTFGICISDYFFDRKNIGDTLISDYFKPKENGWEALYYNEKAENIQYDNVVSINSLNEIFKYLK